MLGLLGRPTRVALETQPEQDLATAWTDAEQQPSSTQAPFHAGAAGCSYCLSALLKLRAPITPVAGLGSVRLQLAQIRRAPAQSA